MPGFCSGTRTEHTVFERELIFAFCSLIACWQLKENTGIIPRGWNGQSNLGRHCNLCYFAQGGRFPTSYTLKACCVLWQEVHIMGHLAGNIWMLLNLLFLVCASGRVWEQGSSTRLLLSGRQLKALSPELPISLSAGRVPILVLPIPVHSLQCEAPRVPSPTLSLQRCAGKLKRGVGAVH